MIISTFSKTKRSSQRQQAQAWTSTPCRALQEDVVNQGQVFFLKKAKFRPLDLQNLRFFLVRNKNEISFQHRNQPILNSLRVKGFFVPSSNMQLKTKTFQTQTREWNKNKINQITFLLFFQTVSILY